MAEDERERREWLSRRELLRRAGLGTAVLLYSGAAAKTPSPGVPRFRHKELAKTLRIIQWRHFVPAYDTWFDNTYTKVWGRKNDCEVIVDHINLTTSLHGRLRRSPRGADTTSSSTCRRRPPSRTRSST